MFYVHTERKAGVFKILLFKELQKAPFSWQVSVNGSPNLRNKAAFSNSSGVEWTEPRNGFQLSVVKPKAK